MRTQKYGAIVCISSLLLHWKNTSPWSQMDCTTEAKVWSAQLVSILVSYGHRPTLFMDQLFWGGSCKYWWYYDGSGEVGHLNERGKIKVWQVTPSKAFRSTSISLSLPNVLIPFSPACPYMQVQNMKNPSFCPHFLISLIHERITIFFIENKGVLSQAYVTNVNQKITRFHFAAFNPDYSQRLPEAMWGATGCEDVGWISSACQVLLCILQSDRDESKGWKWMGHRTCSSSEMKTV